MNLLVTLLLVPLIFTTTLISTQKRIIIWDYDGTITNQQNHSKIVKESLLPNVLAAMQAKDTLNIVCSGIRSLTPSKHKPCHIRPYDPQKDIEKFTSLMTLLPIQAVVFSYALGGNECWVLIKTETGFIVRTAHEDARYCHLKGSFQKPDTGMLQVIKDLLHEWNIITDTIVFIGDMAQDEQAAQACGITFIHATMIHKNDTSILPKKE